MIRAIMKRQCADTTAFILLHGLDKFKETFGDVLPNEEMTLANQCHHIKVNFYISTHGIEKYRDAFEPNENVAILLKDVHKNAANTTFLYMNQ
jgi:hypothetical protein